MPETVDPREVRAEATRVLVEREVELEQVQREKEQAVKTAAQYQNRIKRSEHLLFLTKQQGMTLRAAWRQAVPTSKCADMTATKKAGELIRWYLKTFPLDIKEALYHNGITIYTIAAKVSELFGATLPNGRSDGRTQLQAVQLAAQLAGVAGRNGQPPGKTASDVFAELPAQLLLPPQESDWDSWQKLADETNAKILAGEELKDDDGEDRVPELPVPLPEDDEPWI